MHLYYSWTIRLIILLSLLLVFVAIFKLRRVSSKGLENCGNNSIISLKFLLFTGTCVSVFKSTLDFQPMVDIEMNFLTYND